ncbi:unnamed protein product [Adineta ricciae]|uniref:Uncharacterized protein n=1 Tax=Adineta ricciae TaxID=249248 RepID=A0A814KYM9_ADIRI|nr:unnamed protein product [Adineta ricciae]
MSRRIPSISDLNVQSEQPIKRFKTSPSSLDSSPYRNIFEQFDDVLPSPTVITNTQMKISKQFVPKGSSQHSSTTSSSTARSIMTKTKTKSNDELWSSLFRPKTRHDLVVHPKKVKELQEILERSCEIVKNNHKRPAKLILISGPSGSGKSTCLRILASSMNINIIEWETRTTSNLTTTVSDEQRGSLNN